MCEKSFNFFNNLGDFISRFSEVIVAVHTSIIVALIVLVIQNWCPQNIVLTITFELAWILFLIGTGTGILRTRRGEIVWGIVVAGSVLSISFLLSNLLQQSLGVYWEVMSIETVYTSALLLSQVASILAAVTRRAVPSISLFSIGGYYWFCQWFFIAMLLITMLRNFTICIIFACICATSLVPLFVWVYRHVSRTSKRVSMTIAA